MDNDLNLNDSADLPMGDDNLSDATGGSMGDLSTKDVRQGFSTMGVPNTQTVLPVDNEDDSGENYVGNPTERGGFLSRPEGWER